MKINLQLRISLILFTIVLLALGCVKEPCLDLAELDRQSALTKEWFVNDSVGNRTIVDTNGIRQTLKISASQEHEWDNIVEDDCGNIYGSFSFSIQYNTSLSPLHLLVDIHGSGLSGDGFYLKLRVTNSVASKSTTFDFVTGDCRENNATIDIKEQITIFDRAYSDVLEITFKTTNSPNDIKTLYYSKGYGVIKFIEENGNGFAIQ